MKYNQTAILILVLFIGRIFLILLHELGHGIIAAIFTRQPVTLFFGSHGKTTKNFKVHYGRFTFYFEYNIFKWNGGLCESGSATMSFYEYVVFVIAGPILPFLTAYFYFYIAKNYGNENMYVTAIIFLIMTTFSLIYNLIPKKKHIQLNNGGITYNDGNQLQTAIKHRNVRREYALAIDHYNEKKYSEAAAYFKFVMENGMNGEYIYRLMIYSHLLAKEFDNIKVHIDNFTEKYELSALDLINLGYYYSQIDDHNKALDYYQKSLKMNESWHAHNNIGYTFNIKGDYNDSIIHFDKAIAIDPSHAYAYNNRGLARIKLGNTEDGLKDMERSFSLDPDNSYYYKNMGIYHFDKKEYVKALEYFETALEKDASTYKIQEDITAAREALKGIS